MVVAEPADRGHTRARDPVTGRVYSRSIARAYRVQPRTPTR